MSTSIPAPSIDTPLEAQQEQERAFQAAKQRKRLYAGVAIGALFIISIVLMWFLEYSSIVHEHRQKKLQSEDFYRSKDCKPTCNGAPAYIEEQGPLTLASCDAQPHRLKREQGLKRAFTPTDFKLTEKGSYVCMETCSIGLHSDSTEEDDVSFIQFLKGKFRHYFGKSHMPASPSHVVKANFVRVGDANTPTCHFKDWVDAPEKQECKTPKCRGQVLVRDGTYDVSSCYVNPAHRYRLRNPLGDDISPSDFGLPAGDYVCVETCDLSESSAKGVRRRAELVRNGEGAGRACAFFGWADAASAV